MPCASMIMVASDEFWIRDRNRSSLWRTLASAASFCSMVAPAIRITKKSMNAPMTESPTAWAEPSSQGSHPLQMPRDPTVMARRLQRATVCQTQAPPLAISASATKAKAPQSTGPQPLR